MLRAIKFFLVPLIVLVLLAGCSVVVGSGNIVSEQREVGNFNAVEIAGSGQLIITQGEQESLRVEVDDNILPLVETNVRGRTLHLGLRWGINVLPLARSVKYTLTVRSLNRIDVSGSSSVVVDRLVTDALETNVTGSGEVQIDDLNAGEVEVNISGSGDVELTGAVERQNVTISGSGEYRAGDLVSLTADVQISGSGDAVVWSTETLDVTVSGSGNVDYYGNPQMDQEVSGSGNIQSLGVK